MQQSSLSQAIGISDANMAYAANLASGIGLGLSVIGFLSSRSENRKIINKLGKIQSHLNEISISIEDIKVAQLEILERMDKLPVLIESIADEVVSGHLLEERYSDLIAMEINYQNLGAEGPARYRINAHGWDLISSALVYLVLHENRISKLPNILYWCEFALFASEFRGENVVRALIIEKRGMVTPLYVKLKKMIGEQHGKFLALLDSDYFDGHNFSKNLSNLDDLKFEATAPRKQSITTYYIDCPRGRVPNGCPERIFERTDRKAVQFNASRLEAIEQVPILKNSLQELVQDYANVRESLAMLSRYIDGFSIVDGEIREAIPADVKNPEAVKFDEIQFVEMKI